MSGFTPAPPLTPDQLRASHPSLSVWVNANAGTGKTQVLTARILRLLLKGVPPRQILCLTYTKAAAAEMQNRLNARLSKWAAMPDEVLGEDLTGLMGTSPEDDDLATAKRLFARVIDTPDGIKIRTLHAFCESLLGRFPLEANIPPHFKVIDEVQARERLVRARDNIIEEAGRAPDGPLADALTILAAKLDEGGFAKLMDAAVKERSTLGALYRRAGNVETLIGEVYAQFGLAPGMTEADVLSSHAPADEAALQAAVDLLRAHGNAKTDATNANKIKTWLALSPEERSGPTFVTYMSVFLTTKKEPRAETGLATKAVKEAAPHILDILLAEQDRLVALVDRLKALRLADVSAAALIIAFSIVARYSALKGQHAELDYDDLILAALDLLSQEGGVSWVHYKLDGGLAHLLVDEAQDTSPPQWRIIEALTGDFFSGDGAWPEDDRDARTVFVVGDQKQSIYSFQGADPDRFDEERRRLAKRITAAGQNVGAVQPPVPLTTSFRSVESVLKAVDLTFSTPDAVDGLSPDGRPLVHVTSRARAPGLVEVWPPEEKDEAPEQDPWDDPVDQPKTGSGAEKLARRIAGTIKDWFRTGERLAAKNRPLRYGDILILVRGRDQVFDLVIRALKEAGVPVAGSDQLKLVEHIAVLDLIALGRFALLPDDDLNLAALLKSPLLGLTDEDLIALAPRRTGTLWQALRDRAHEVPSWAESTTYLTDVLARADQSPPFDFYQWALSAKGGRAKLLARLGPDAEDPIDEFLNWALSFERDHVPSLEAFLFELTRVAPTVKRELAASGNAVRVMTVHGAKGLEAPVVFLVNNRPKRWQRKRPPLLLPDDGLPVLTPSDGDAPKDAIALKQAQALKDDREDRRLLYVGLTRAEDRLYLVSHSEPIPGSWDNLVRDGLKAAGTTSYQDAEGRELLRMSGGDAVDNEAVVLEETPSPAELPDWISTPPPPDPTPVRPLSASAPEDGPAPRSPLDDAGADPFKRGRLIHKLLQLLPDVAAPNRRARCAEWLARPVHNLAPEDQTVLTDEVMAVLERPDLSSLFGPGSLAEVPLTGLIGDRGLTARLDRLLVTDTQVTVLDYKTNRPPPEHISDVAPAYLRQMALYREALRRLYHGRTIIAQLLWTDTLRLMTLSDDLLDAHMPSLFAHEDGNR